MEIVGLVPYSSGLKKFLRGRDFLGMTQKKMASVGLWGRHVPRSAETGFFLR